MLCDSLSNTAFFNWKWALRRKAVAKHSLSILRQEREFPNFWGDFTMVRDLFEGIEAQMTDIFKGYQHRMIRKCAPSLAALSLLGILGCARLAGLNHSAEKPSPRPTPKLVITRSSDNNSAKENSEASNKDDTSGVFPAETPPANPEGTACPCGTPNATSIAERLPLTAKLFELPESTVQLPHFSELNPKNTIKLQDVNFPVRRYEQGFPGFPEATEYFGVLIEGTLTSTTTGLHEFSLLSDDGSKLYLNDKLVVDNDFSHGAIEKVGSFQLDAGVSQKFRLEYFQGSRQFLGLVLSWKSPNDIEFKAITPESFH